MATPSMHRSFDASLTHFDINTQSFSSTETATSSGSSHKENRQPIDESSNNSATALTEEKALKSLTTAELYESWARTYDTDGNVLQAVDDIQMRPAITSIICDALARRHELSIKQPPLRILDLGCGTGRNLLKIVDHAILTQEQAVRIEAWDASEHMLAQARAKCAARYIPDEIGLVFKQVELEQISVSELEPFDIIISTLVLEHIPIETYWKAIVAVLKPGGVGQMSNMHPHMGQWSVAGFTDSDGARLVGKSFLHGVQETVDGAHAVGLKVSNVREVAVTAEMLDKGEVGDRGWKWVDRRIWYGLQFRKGDTS